MSEHKEMISEQKNEPIIFNRTQKDRVAITPEANCGRNNNIRSTNMSRKNKSEKFKVIIGTNGQHSFEYKGIPVANGHLIEKMLDGEITYRAMVGGDGNVDGLIVNGSKDKGMELQQDNDGTLWLIVDGVELTLNNNQHRTYYWARYKTYFLLTDNRIDIDGSWYSTSHNRLTAFNEAAAYIGYRMASGMPTKTPYVLTIEEIKTNKKAGRKWEIKLEIANVSASTPKRTDFLLHKSITESSEMNDGNKSQSKEERNAQ